jgi:hypothetical protein
MLVLAFEVSLAWAKARNRWGSSLESPIDPASTKRGSNVLVQ